MSDESSARRPVILLGTGHSLPMRQVASSELDVKLKLAKGSVERATGVRTRYFAGENETAGMLAANACRHALDAAGLGWADIDCLVAASGSMDQGMPSNAALIHSELGLQDSGIPAFDVNASCLGFLAALDLLSWPVLAGRYRRVMIVCADVASCALDWTELGNSGIFGDGAAAAVIARSPRGSGSQILAADLKTLSAGVDFCKIPGGGTRFHPTRIQGEFNPLATFQMDGKAVFRLVSQHLPGFLEQLLARAGRTVEQVDWIVPHQASQLAIEHMTRRLGLKPERVINIFSDHGNQVAASLPTALDLGISDGRIRRGDCVLLLGTGAGVSIGGNVMVY